MPKKIFPALIIAVCLFALAVQVGFSQDTEQQNQIDTAQLMRKLDTILANQAEIIKQFEMIKQELEIIKVRASR
ncbi:MAG: hypothetical protein JW714_00290 [Candidatus Omnitrophica bacterium]|nr:hypothetical protein [Candidatus Omnitrophota bacterium]